MSMKKGSHLSIQRHNTHFGLHLKRKMRKRRSKDQDALFDRWLQ